MRKLRIECRLAGIDPFQSASPWAAWAALAMAGGALLGVAVINWLSRGAISALLREHSISDSGRMISLPDL